MIRFARRCRPAAICAVLALAAACADRTPTAPPASAAPEPTAALSALRCTVDVRAGTLACRPSQPAPASGVRSVILGGQGLNVRLASSGTSYDAGTGILRTDVTVENLTGQMLGTTDGYLPAPEGVRVFFATGPDVTEGTGTVTVANADGTDVFTSAGQSFFRYPGILAPGDTTAAKEWRFALPETVTAFTFTVYVAAPVSQEGGWLVMTPAAPSLVAGGTLQLSALVRGVTGRPADGAPVAWSIESSGDSLATVDSTGLLRVYQPGFVTVAASTGDREGRVTVHVRGPQDPGVPMILSVEVSPAMVEPDGVDSVTVRVAASDVQPIQSIAVTLVSPNQQVGRQCDTVTRISGTQANGVFACKFGFAPGAIGGVWRVTDVTVTGAQNSRSISEFGYGLQNAGIQTGVYVRGPLSDYIPPTLFGFSFSPDSVRTVKDTLTIEVAAMDADTGIASVKTTLTNGNGQTVGCIVVPTGGTIYNGLYRCRMVIPGFITSTGLEVRDVEIRDRNNNLRVVSGSELEQNGFPRFLQVRPDTVPPTVTAFTASPATVAANGVDSVVVTITGSDSWSGVKSLETRFVKDGADANLFQRNCLGGFTAAPSRTVKCALRFAAGDAGTWRMQYLHVVDNANNLLALTAAQADSAGYTTVLTVTP
ncbi:MAG TPA: Ig-like domain-containing protein [Longimicrobium sp.]|nr:Ig-like domain-containing protein [Longimicrobium sp.]